jgi:hypothetical protein
MVCGTEITSAGAGLRYLDVADAINLRSNYFYSICNTSYQPFFEDLVDSVFALGRQFFLSELALADSIVVTIDGEPTTDFSYDAIGNSVIFDEGHAPAAGSEVRVNYRKQCPE